MTHRRNAPDVVFRRTAHRLLVSVRVRETLRGAALAIGGAALWVAWTALALGWPARVPPTAKRLALVALLLGSAWLTLDRVVGPLLELGGLRRFCRRLDAGISGGNALVAAEEASRVPARWRVTAVASLLTDRLLETAVAALRRLDPVRALALRKGTADALRAAALVALAVAGLWASGPVGVRGLDRLRHPGAPEGPPVPSGLYLTGGDREVVAGEDARVAALDFGDSPAPVVCEVRAEHGVWKTATAAPDTVVGPRPYRRFTARLAALREDVRVRFRRAGFVTREARIAVVRPPLLASLAVRISPPAYTGLPAVDYPRAPSRLEVPSGSRLDWTGLASLPVVRACLAGSAGDTLDWTAAGDTVRGALVAHGNSDWRLVLTDRRGLSGVSDVVYEVRATPDRAPTARLERPGDDGMLPGDGRLTLTAQAQDDYGVAGLDLLLRREVRDAPSDTAWTRLPVVRGRRETGTPLGPAVLETAASDSALTGVRVACGLDLDTGDLSLVPGDVLLLALEARDNRRPGPPARGRSRTLRLTVPSAGDLLAAQLAGGEERLEKLDDLHRKGSDLREELDRLHRELEKNPRPDFARRQEIDEALDRQQQLQKELENLTDRMREQIDRMAGDNLTSVSLVERLEQVSQLLDEIHDDNIDRMRAQLGDAVSKMTPEQIRDAVSDVASRQKEFLDRLDRSIAMLEQLKKEQQMSALTDRVERMLREQSELDAAAECDSASAGADREPSADRGSQDEARADADAAQKRRQLAADADSLQRDIEEALAKLQESQPDKEGSPAEDAMREALQKAKEQLDKGDLSKALKQLAEKRSAAKSVPDSPAQSRAMQELAALYHVLMQGQASMQLAMQHFAGDALRRLAFDVLAISQREETLADDIPADLRDVRAPDLAREQKRLLRATAALRTKLEKALGMSSAIPFQVLQKLDGTTDAMQPIVADLEAGYGASARDGARRGLGMLNELVMNLLTSAQMTGGGGSGSLPMPALSDQLEQMARDQAGLNGLTEQLSRQLGQQGLSQSARAQMQRLQSQQQGLTDQMKSAADQQRRNPGGERILGDLSELARDMEGVADAIRDGDVDEEILRRQDRILDRMLDARNSIRKRDFSSRRESRTALETFRDQSGSTGAETSRETSAPWRLEAKRLDRVPLEYRDMVRRYFESLSDIEGGDAGGAPGGRP